MYACVRARSFFSYFYCCGGRRTDYAVQCKYIRTAGLLLLLRPQVRNSPIIAVTSAALDVYDDGEIEYYYACACVVCARVCDVCVYVRVSCVCNSNFIGSRVLPSTPYKCIHRDISHKLVNTVALIRKRVDTHMDDMQIYYIAHALTPWDWASSISEISLSFQ